MNRKPVRKKITLIILLLAAFSILIVRTLIRFIDQLGSSYQMLG